MYVCVLDLLIAALSECLGEFLHLDMMSDDGCLRWVLDNEKKGMRGAAGVYALVWGCLRGDRMT